MFFTYIDSAVGKLLLAGEHESLSVLSFTMGSKAMQPKEEWIHAPSPFREVTRQLNAYFKGDLHHFELPLSPHGTPFQLKVWKELCEIPYGETTSYGALAAKIGNPNASRAVGLANGSNPIAIIVPCHRVIGSTGKLTGFGGGLDIKQRLLDLERGSRLLAMEASAR